VRAILIALGVLIAALPGAGPAGATTSADAPRLRLAQNRPKLGPARPAKAAPPAVLAPDPVASDGPRAALLARLIANGESAQADEEIVRFEPVARAGTTAMHLGLATRVNATPARVIALLADPATYLRAVPAFVRADVRAHARAPSASRLLAWELEIPLWNFEGQLWLHPLADGAILDLVQGDLTPGHLEMHVSAHAGGSIVVLSGNVNLKDANWITRRLAARDALAEPAMAVTAMYVLLRGLRLELERPAAPPQPGAGLTGRRWPTAPMHAPDLKTLDGLAFAQRLVPDALAAAAASSSFARVISRADGRLDRIDVVVPAALPSATVEQRVLQPERWRALPGWKQITPSPGSGEVKAFWRVDAGLPFVDFDATWSLLAQRPLRALARSGDWTAPVIGVDVVARALDRSAVVFMTHPRVDRTGFIPRRLITAEPLLEHGLGLGLAFVNAQALTRAIGEAK
jgi:hypothetical protein